MKTTEVKRNQFKQEGNDETPSDASFENVYVIQKIKKSSGILRKLKIKTAKVLVITFTIGSVITVTGCNSSAEKVENAESDLLKAERALDEANAEYIADIENYRVETKNRIQANNQSIIEFNERIKNDKKEAKAEYMNKIAELDQKNTDLEKRIDEYKADTEENWQLFKAEFNKDMEELGLALKNLTTNSN